MKCSAQQTLYSVSCWVILDCSTQQWQSRNWAMKAELKKKKSYKADDNMHMVLSGKVHKGVVVAS